MERLAEFVKSVLAGVMISIGGFVFLSCDNKYGSIWAKTFDSKIPRRAPSNLSR